MNINRIILAILIAGAPLQAASQPSFLERQYNQFKSDLNLIKKCYLTRSAACTQQERIEARNAALRVSAEGAALILTIGGLGYGGYVLHGKKVARDKAAAAQAKKREDEQARRAAIRAKEFQERLDAEEGRLARTAQKDGENAAREEKQRKLEEEMAKAEQLAKKQREEAAAKEEQERNRLLEQGTDAEVAGIKFDEIVLIIKDTKDYSDYTAAKDLLVGGIVTTSFKTKEEINKEIQQIKNKIHQLTNIDMQNAFQNPNRLAQIQQDIKLAEYALASRAVSLELKKRREKNN